MSETLKPTTTAFDMECKFLFSFLPWLIDDMNICLIDSELDEKVKDEFDDLEDYGHMNDETNIEYYDFTEEDLSENQKFLQNRKMTDNSMSSNYDNECKFIIAFLPRLTDGICFINSEPDEDADDFVIVQDELEEYDQVDDYKELMTSKTGIDTVFDISGTSTLQSHGNLEDFEIIPDSTTDLERECEHILELLTPLILGFCSDKEDYDQLDDHEDHEVENPDNSHATGEGISETPGNMKNTKKTPSSKESELCDYILTFLLPLLMEICFPDAEPAYSINEYEKLLNELELSSDQVDDHEELYIATETTDAVIEYFYVSEELPSTNINLVDVDMIPTVMPMSTQFDRECQFIRAFIAPFPEDICLSGSEPAEDLQEFDNVLYIPGPLLRTDKLDDNDQMHKFEESVTANTDGNIEYFDMEEDLQTTSKYLKNTIMTPTSVTMETANDKEFQFIRTFLVPLTDDIFFIDSEPTEPADYDYDLVTWDPLVMTAEFEDYDQIDDYYLNISTAQILTDATMRYSEADEEWLSTMMSMTTMSLENIIDYLKWQLYQPNESIAF